MEAKYKYKQHPYAQNFKLQKKIENAKLNFVLGCDKHPECLKPIQDGSNRTSILPEESRS